MHFRVLLNHHNSKEGVKPRSPLGTRSIDFAKKDEVVGIEVGRDDDLLGRGGVMTKSCFLVAEQTTCLSADSRRGFATRNSVS